MDIDFSTLKDHEINDMIVTLIQERDARLAENKCKAWKKVKSAICDYLVYDKSIIINCDSETYYLDNVNEMLADVGHINIDLF